MSHCLGTFSKRIVSQMCVSSQLNGSSQVTNTRKLLYKHNQFEWQHAGSRELMHLAWAASDCWPRPITHPEADKLHSASKMMVESHGGEDGRALLPRIEKFSEDKWRKDLEKDSHSEWT